MFRVRLCALTRDTAQTAQEIPEIHGKESGGMHEVTAGTAIMYLMVVYAIGLLLGYTIGWSRRGLKDKE
jgi:hypothetical protein